MLFGSCIALGAGELPYAPLIEALRRLVRDVGQERVRDLAGSGYPELANLLADFADVAPPLAGVTAGWSAQSRVFGAVLRLLEGLGPDDPVALLLEGLQWADPSTVDLLAYLARTLSNERLLLVVTYRTELPNRHPLRTLVAELDRARRVQLLDVARFG